MLKLKENYLLIIVMVIGIVAAIIIANMFTKQVPDADGNLKTALNNPLSKETATPGE
jgi:hypothetical protein